MKLPATIANVVRRVRQATGLTAPNSRWQRVWDSYTGQWQQDVEVETDAVLAFGAVFSCIRLIATDIGKLRPKLITLADEAYAVWVETESTAFSPVLRKPNHYQTRIKFYEQWITMKLIHGRTPVLKQRDRRGQVVDLRVIDPLAVEPLVSESGAVFFRLQSNDPLFGLEDDVVIAPAREIIYDVHITPEHPLVGVGPIGACGLAATQGLKMQRNSAKFFANMSRPSFVLSAPGAISNETAERLKASWEANFGGANYGRTAILGDGLEPKSFTLTAEDSQLIEQLNWTGEDACRAFGVPAYKVGIGSPPANTNVEALEQQYYSQCLQELIECIELLLDEGLELPTHLGVEFDLTGLLRMDSKTRAEVDAIDIKSGILAPNEGRAKRELMPVLGGESPMMQQQNFSLAALAKRDAQDNPFATAPPPAAEPPEDETGEAPEGDEVDEGDESDEENGADELEARAVLALAAAMTREAA